MSMSHEDKAMFGVGVAAGGTGIVTIAGATSAVSSTFLATGISNAVAAAPAIGKIGLLVGKAVSAYPPLIPAVIIGGIVYGIVNWILADDENAKRVS